MDRIDWKAKFGSRKFLLALMSIIVGIVTIVTNDDALVQIVAQVGGILIPLIVYIVTEGVIDVKRILQSSMDISDLFELVEGEEDEDIIE
jgi:hypothetical protein